MHCCIWSLLAVCTLPQLYRFKVEVCLYVCHNGLFMHRESMLRTALLVYECDFHFPCTRRYTCTPTLVAENALWCLTAQSRIRCRCCCCCMLMFLRKTLYLWSNHQTERTVNATVPQLLTPPPPPAQPPGMSESSLDNLSATQESQFKKRRK